MLEPGFSLGDMTDPLIFERDVSEKSATTGAPKPWTTPSTVLSCLGRVREVEGGRSSEVVINNRTVTLKMYDIVIHYTTLLTEQMRVKLADGRYLFLRRGAKPVSTRQRFLEIRAEEVQ